MNFDGDYYRSQLGLLFVSNINVANDNNKTIDNKKMDDLLGFIHLKIFQYTHSEHQHHQQQEEDDNNNRCIRTLIYLNKMAVSPLMQLGQLKDEILSLVGLKRMLNIDDRNHLRIRLMHSNKNNIQDSVDYSTILSGDHAQLKKLIKIPKTTTYNNQHNNNNFNIAIQVINNTETLSTYAMSLRCCNMVATMEACTLLPILSPIRENKKVFTFHENNSKNGSSNTALDEFNAEDWSLHVQYGHECLIERVFDVGEKPLLDDLRLFMNQLYPDIPLNNLVCLKWFPDLNEWVCLHDLTSSFVNYERNLLEARKKQKNNNSYNDDDDDDNDDDIMVQQQPKINHPITSPPYDLNNGDIIAAIDIHMLNYSIDQKTRWKNFHFEYFLQNVYPYNGFTLDFKFLRKVEKYNSNISPEIPTSYSNVLRRLLHSFSPPIESCPLQNINFLHSPFERVFYDVKDETMIILFFSTNKEGPSRRFLIEFKRLCLTAAWKRYHLLVIIIPLHCNEVEYIELLSLSSHPNLTWYCLPINNRRNIKLQKLYQIKCAPSLLVLNWNGNIIKSNAEIDIYRMKEKSIMKWFEELTIIKKEKLEERRERSRRLEENKRIEKEQQIKKRQYKLNSELNERTTTLKRSFQNKNDQNDNSNNNNYYFNNQNNNQNSSVKHVREMLKEF